MVIIPTALCQNCCVEVMMENIRINNKSQGLILRYEKMARGGIDAMDCHGAQNMIDDWDKFGVGQNVHHYGTFVESPYGGICQDERNKSR